MVGQSNAGIAVPVAEGCSLSSHSLFFVLLSERLFKLGETFLHSLSTG